MKRLTLISTTVLLLLVISSSVFAHCQVPCGIYGDKTRFDMLREHITTVEKSMNQIKKLSADAANNMNQLVRWVNNKEKLGKMQKRCRNIVIQKFNKKNMVLATERCLLRKRS